MQIGPRLGNSRLCVIRSFQRAKTEKAAHAARLFRRFGVAPYFSEATGPLAAAGSGSNPNTPTRYL